MVDYDILAECGTTNQAIRDFFTVAPPSPRQAKKMTPAEITAVENKIKARQKWQDKISGIINEHVVFSLRNHKLYGAVDLAWDSMPINRFIMPLMQYATGRIDMARCATALKDIPNGETYVKKNAQGTAVAIDLPKFTEVNINLLRSVITRRVAAQAVKYNNSYPFYVFPPRDRSQVGKLKGEMVSERVDIMVEQYDYRHFQTQLTRDMFLYGHGVAFPRASWEREVQWVKKSVAPEFAVTGKISKTSKVVKEGVALVNPHPSRVFYDNAFPLSSINRDIGCKYIGFWDVTRWGDIGNNPDYFNRDKVQYSANSVSWFAAYSAYFQQYYDTVTPPQFAPIDDASANNDRKNNVGRYQVGMEGVSTFFTDLRVKVIPREEGWGDYPYPIWVLLKVAGDSTVVYADILPSGPAAYYGYNENDSRMVSASVAHELLPLQDQLTNLFSQLLETCKADLFSVAVLNTDVFPDTPEGKKVMEEFKAILSGKNYYASMQVLAASFDKLKALGISVTADNVFKVVRAAPNTGIDKIFSAITTTLAMADRLQVMSQHEQGQVAPHEISATESNQIAGSTDTIYSFISTGIDEGREAVKRILFESIVASDSDEVRLSVDKRYPENIVKEAGFEVVAREGGDVGYMTVTGNKGSLVTEYVFSSRDGGNRQSNSQAAGAIVQLVQAIGSLNPSAQNAILGAMGKSKLFELFNTAARMADAGVDWNLQVKPGENDALMVEDEEQVMQIIQRLGQAVQQIQQDLAQVEQTIGIQPQQGQQQGTGQPPMQAGGMQ